MTSIQKLLGHCRLNSTMIYTRVHDRTVAEDYYAAMARIEKCLSPTAGTDDADEPVSAGERTQLLELVGQLAEPQLGLNDRLVLVAQMRRVLHHETSEQVESPAGGNGKGDTVWADLADPTTLPSIAQSW